MPDATGPVGEGGAWPTVAGGVVRARLVCALPVACMCYFRHFLQDGPVRVEIILLHAAHCPLSTVARKPSGRGGGDPLPCA